MPDKSEIKGFTFASNNAQGLEEYQHSQTGMIFVLIPGGKFLMGADDEKHNRDTKPVHSVNISKFLLAKHPVTQGVWQKIAGNNPSSFAKGGNYPVEAVSWDKCHEFCQKAGLRLPTEAEWEYACRAGASTQYYWGDQKDKDYMWYQENSEETTHPVGLKKPNQFGLHDMAGNVWEWCQDWYDAYPSGAQTNPAGPANGELKVMRGGSWFSFSYNCRSANRFGAKPGKMLNLNGFRCACSV